MKKTLQNIQLSKLNQSKKLVSLQNMGFKFTIGKSTRDILKSSKINVYTSPEFDSVNEYLQSRDYYKLVPKGNAIEVKKEIFSQCVFSNEQFRAKYFALLPLLLEDNYTLHGQKKYVLEMNVLPEVKYLQFKALAVDGVLEFVEPIEDIIPITPEDYRVRHRVLRSRPARFADMDMVYTNYKSMMMYIFDKQGNWNKEGVEHEVLDIKNTMEEHTWFDHLKSDNHWH